jgi:hypothetical protein
LVPLLIEFQRRRIADLDSDLSRMPAGEARNLVEQHLSLKRRHLEVLQEMLKTMSNKQPATV